MCFNFPKDNMVDDPWFIVRDFKIVCSSSCIDDFDLYIYIQVNSYKMRGMNKH